MEAGGSGSSGIGDWENFLSSKVQQQDDTWDVPMSGTQQNSQEIVDEEFEVLPFGEVISTIHAKVARVERVEKEATPFVVVPIAQVEAGLEIEKVADEVSSSEDEQGTTSSRYFFTYWKFYLLL